MDNQTIVTLNQINQRFYEEAAEAFDQTRQQPWPGWEAVWRYVSPTLPHHPKVLDVGCGNGRFGEFLQTKLASFAYTGVDQSQSLLKVARTKLPNARFVHSDITSSSMIRTVNETEYDVVTVFGVLHHVPGIQTRQELLNSLVSVIVDKGHLCFSLWKFMEEPKIRSHVVPWSEGLAGLHLKLDQNQLETNDYLITWQDHDIRYAHYYDREEEDQLIHQLPLNHEWTFSDDGRNHRLNAYHIFKKLSG